MDEDIDIHEHDINDPVPEQPQATFDYLSIHAVVEYPSVKHAAHGLPYSEYRKKRARSTDTSMDDRQGRVHFYCDPFTGSLLPSLARRRNVSLYSYINDMLEEGLIHFHPEYHEIYEEINNLIDDMQLRSKTEAQARAVLKMRHQKVSPGSICSRGNPHFAPRISNWLSEDIRTVSVDLHMTVSDTAYLYIITGILYTDAPEMPLPDYHDKVMSEYLRVFSSELKSMLSMCRHIYNDFNNLN